jgi:hypothetical protein
MHEARPPLRTLTPEQIRARAKEYREMAGTARAAGSMESLLKIARQFEAMAERREMPATKDE